MATVHDFILLKNDFLFKCTIINLTTIYQLTLLQISYQKRSLKEDVYKES